MTPPADLRFFSALHAACHAEGGVDPRLVDALVRALDTGAPTDLLAARKAFDTLETALKARLMQQVHRHMVTDISAIWNALPGAHPGQRPN
ncbi:hypothetical protein [Marinovum sp.]|uniref:hypothetical protein n=1 Tax=Marinovum sp. TaxID=2024839 RepID=UPI002B26642A|nr:hypothetical protein [Marinovum sp.]